MRHASMCDCSRINVVSTGFRGIPAHGCTYSRTQGVGDWGDFATGIFNAAIGIGKEVGKGWIVSQITGAIGGGNKPPAQQPVAQPPQTTSNAVPTALQTQTATQTSAKPGSGSAMIAVGVGLAALLLFR